MFKREGFYQFLHCNLRYVLQYILFKKFFLKEVYKNKIYMIQLSNSFKFFRKQKYEECVCVRERQREASHPCEPHCSCYYFSFTCFRRFSIMITLFKILKK